MVSQRQEGITLEPLLTTLSSYKLSEAPPAQERFLQGDSHGHYMPRLYDFIVSKGFKVFHTMEDGLDVLANVPSVEIAIQALDMIMGKGHIAGITAHSSNIAILPNMVMFDFPSMHTQLSPNQQLAVVVHEIGHVLTPLGPEAFTADLSTQRCMLEIIAYGTQFGVMQALGLDSLADCVWGMARYGASPQAIEQHAGQIQVNCGEILQWISTHE